MQNKSTEAQNTLNRPKPFFFSIDNINSHIHNKPLSNVKAGIWKYGEKNREKLSVKLSQSLFSCICTNLKIIISTITSGVPYFIMTHLLATGTPYHVICLIINYQHPMSKRRRVQKLTMQFLNFLKYYFNKLTLWNSKSP